MICAAEHDRLLPVLHPPNSTVCGCVHVHVRAPHPARLCPADFDCFMLDQYLWVKQDLLMFFAAGNDGAVTSRLTTTGTVGSPALSKNVLAVGATENWQGSSAR